MTKPKHKSHNSTKKINSTKTKSKNSSTKTKTSEETKAISIEKINYSKTTNPSIKKYTSNKPTISKPSTVSENKNKNFKVPSNLKSSTSTRWKENKSKIFIKYKSPPKKRSSQIKINSTKTSKITTKSKSKNSKKIMNLPNMHSMKSKELSLKSLKNSLEKVPETESNKIKTNLKITKLPNY